MVAVRSLWLAQSGLSGSAPLNALVSSLSITSSGSEYADLVLSLRTIGPAFCVLGKRQRGRRWSQAAPCLPRQILSDRLFVGKESPVKNSEAIDLSL